MKARVRGAEFLSNVSVTAFVLAKQEEGSFLTTAAFISPRAAVLVVKQTWKDVSNQEAKLTCKFPSPICTSNHRCDLFLLKRAAYIVFQLAVTPKCSIQTEKSKKREVFIMLSYILIVTF